MEVALLPLVEMGTAPPIVPGYDMLQPVIRFSHQHVYSDNCSCLIEQHSGTMAVIWLSCACKRTDCHLSSNSFQFIADLLFGGFWLTLDHPDQFSLSSRWSYVFSSWSFDCDSDTNVPCQCVQCVQMCTVNIWTFNCFLMLWCNVCPSDFPEFNP